MLLQWLRQLTGSKRTLVAALQKCAPGSSSFPLLNSDQNKTDRLWDSLRDLFSNSSSEFLENFSFCLHTQDVSDASTLLNQCSHVCHLTSFQICLSTNFFNFLGGFFKKKLSVEQTARNYKTPGMTPHMKG